MTVLKMTSAIVCAFFIIVSYCSSACDLGSEVESLANKYKSSLLKIDKSIFDNIEYPVEVVVNGTLIEISSKVSLEPAWSYIATKEFSNNLKKLSACELARKMGLSRNDAIIKSLVIDWDESDSQYSSSGISSAKKLKHFINEANRYFDDGDYITLSYMFHFPMTIKVVEKTIAIENRRELIEYSQYIFNDKFKKIINSNVVINVGAGVMLNNSGDVWVIGHNGDLLFKLAMF